MKLTVAQNVLANGLKKVLSVVSSRTTLPVLNNILLQAVENKLFIVSTDLEIYIKCAVDAVVERPGMTTLPAKKFSQIIGSLPDGSVCLETDERQHTAIACQKSNFKIAGLDAEEFPKEERCAPNWSFTLTGRTLRKILAKVSYARSLDETRLVLNGILLSVRNGTLTSAATDGKRMALVELDLENQEIPDGDVILPPKLVMELEKILEDNGDLTAEFSDSQACFEQNDTLIVSKLIDGVYPNYRQVIPAGFSQSAAIPREIFTEVLNRVTIVISENNPSVNFKLNKTVMTASAISSEIGESSEPLDISYDGDEIDIAFNPVFISEPLRHLEADQLVLQFNDEFSPVCISGDEGFIYVLMPMRN